MSVSYTQSSPRTFDELFASEFPVIVRTATLASGAGALTRGAVLGKITASGKYLLSLSGALDGSEVPDAILAEDADATSADAQVMIYLAGDFRADQLTIGSAHTAASIRDGLRDKGIYI